ncbi:hypothetical protein [Streptomyces justiciae]|uniref:hypothetical protein n=1 Tax=Streptomyces justiciae TaxID=2780140 RepID=UPI002242E8D6|nr:hypothetical protein [Streptomyces justiciae]MCW8383964.1 hypothetical protein [Streptomyces justiciae]
MPEDKKTSSLRAIPHARRPRKTTPRSDAGSAAKVRKEKKPSCSGSFRAVARYPYIGADGELAGTKIRRECSGCPVCQAEGGKPGKRISWERPAGETPCTCETCEKYGRRGIELHMPDNAPLWRADRLAAAPEGSTVYLGEGEKVVEAAERLGLLATTKPGSASTRWNPDHTPLFAGKHVVILCDRDTPGYTSARDAREALLEDTASIRVLHTPLDAKGADLDDHVRAGLGLDDLVVVPEDVLDPEAAAKDQTAALVEPAAVAASSGGEWPGEEPIPGDDGRPNKRDEYTVRRGEIVRVLRRQSGTDESGAPVYEVAFETVLGCMATIVRVETRDIGDSDQHDPFRPVVEEDLVLVDDVIEQRPTTGYVLELVHPKRLDEPVLMRVTRKDFDDGTWLHDLPWPGVYYKRTRTSVAQIATAISAVSPPDCERVPVFAATGWRRTPSGQWLFVHADGGITPFGHVPLRTRFPGRLSRMALPQPSADPARIREAADAALSITVNTPLYAAAPLLGLTLRAPYFRCPSSICLTGLPGSGKTGLGSLFQRFFAPRADRNETLLSISDTGSTQLGTTELMFRMKDVLVMGDDSAPDKSVRDASVRTSRMGRTQYNGEGRVRLKQVDGMMELDDQHGPRGSLIQTSEVLASTESAQQRMLTLQLARHEIDIDQLARMSQPEFGYDCAQLMASYIRWIAADYERHCATVRTLANTYAALLRPYCGDRPAEHLGQFATGWHMLLRYLLEVGAYDADDVAGWWATAWNGLLEAADRERTLLENQTMHRRLLGYLATALSGRHAHLVGPDGKCPANYDTALRYGWSVQDNAADDPGNPNPGRPVLRAGGVRLGVVTTVTKQDGSTEERVWLDHQAATSIALRMAAELQETWTVTANVLTDALRQAGLIEVEFESTKRGRWVKARRPMPGGRRRVWDMPASALELNCPDGDDDPGLSTGPDRPPLPPAPTADPLFDLSALTTPTPHAPDAPAVVPPASAARTPDVPAASAKPVVAVEEPTLPEPETVTAAEQAPGRAQDVEQAVPEADRPGATPDVPAEEPADETAAAARADEVEVVDDAPEASGDPDEGLDDHPADTSSPTAPWRAAAAVAHTDGIYLPDGAVVPLPPIEDLHAGRFAELVDELGLGHGGSRRGSGASRKWRPDAGQIYISAALTEVLGLPVPEDGPAAERRAFLAEHVDHPFLARARAAGWNVTKWGNPTRIWRERDGEERNLSAQLIVVPHVALTTRFLEDDPAPALLARRVQQLADTVGITYRSTAGVTGHELLRATRPKNGRRAAPLEPAELPELLMERRNMYVAKVWDRQPTAEECKMRFVLLFDARASYLSVTSSLKVGRGKIEHRVRPEFDPEIPGLWLARAPKWEHWGCFDPFGPRREDGARLYLTPTLAYAHKDLKADIEVEEAWVWPDRYRMLESWYRQLSTARKTLAPGTDETVAATLKDVYTNAVGLFNSDHLRGRPEYGTQDSDLFRPDVQQAVLAAQQANLVRTITRIGEQHKMWPIAVKTDMLAYVTDDPDFATAVPGLKMEANLGNFKPEGAALAEDVFAHLKGGAARGWFPTASAFMPAEEWTAQYGGEA